jgi:competence protein ComEC
MVIGETGGITPQQRDLMARGGVSHLFAISGQHLSLIAIFLWRSPVPLSRSERLFLAPRRFLPLPSSPAASLSALTGNILSARGPSSCPWAVLYCCFGQARTHPCACSAPAFLILLAGHGYSNLLPARRGAHVLLLVPRWMRCALPMPLYWAAVLLLTTLAATAATTPLVLLHFHLLAPAGIPINLLAVPVIGFLALPAGLLGALLAPGWATGGALLLRVVL